MCVWEFCCMVMFECVIFMFFFYLYLFSCNCSYLLSNYLKQLHTTIHLFKSPHQLSAPHYFTNPQTYHPPPPTIIPLIIKKILELRLEDTEMFLNENASTHLHQLLVCAVVQICAHPFVLFLQAYLCLCELLFMCSIVYNLHL